MLFYVIKRYLVTGRPMYYKGGNIWTSELPAARFYKRRSDVTQTIRKQNIPLNFKEGLEVMVFKCEEVKNSSEYISAIWGIEA